ncbi:MAG: hypothetical protein PF505_03285 [Vallitaleaceae bacterium]|jgi:hypothetical protein|nr:hypothetical protein [Vallitaleaceae bacterium]
MKGQFKIVFGLMLVLVGVLGILSSLDVIYFNIWSFWAYIYFGIGLVFELGYFTGKRKNGGLLIVGGIFLVIGAIFIACTLYSWGLMYDLWPLFIIAPGFGFLQAYVIHKRSLGFLIPAGILLFIGIAFLNYTLFRYNENIVLSVGLIVFGILILFKPNNRLKDKKQVEINKEPVVASTVVGETVYSEVVVDEVEEEL